jgi:hypothetical protein
MPKITVELEITEAQLLALLTSQTLAPAKVAEPAQAPAKVAPAKVAPAKAEPEPEQEVVQHISDANVEDLIAGLKKEFKEAMTVHDKGFATKVAVEVGGADPKLTLAKQISSIPLIKHSEVVTALRAGPAEKDHGPFEEEELLDAQDNLEAADVAAMVRKVAKEVSRDTAKGCLTAGGLKLLTDLDNASGAQKLKVMIAAETALAQPEDL